MGRIKQEKKERPKRKLGSLRKRWLMNTASVVCSLGMACTLAVTAAFAVYFYSDMETDMRCRARTAVEYFAHCLNMSESEFYQSCILYTQSFEDDTIALQFIDADGQIIVSSGQKRSGASPDTPEILEAVGTRGIQPYRGKDFQSGEQVLSVSAPIIDRNGEVIGVLRYVIEARFLNRRILIVALLCLLALALVVTVVLFSSNSYIHSVLVPLAQITEKAKRIAGGTYGIQIQIKSNDEIGELAETINDLSAKISQNEKLQTEFISSLSHELRTPLTAITGWSETLLNCETLDKETTRGVKIILREAKRLTEMVVDLLDFTRIQDGRMTLNIEQADIRSEFEDTVYMYGSRLAQDGIALELLDNDEEIPEIPCDPKRLRQVFLNILDNAAKHGGEGKRIEASIRYREGSVIVQIRDFGSGIPEDELPLVKKKFYRGSSKVRGTGIGLAVSDEIVQMHGGCLTLENAAGGGTLVTVRLPAAQ